MVWFIIAGLNDDVDDIDRGYSTKFYTGYLDNKCAILWKATLHRVIKGRNDHPLRGLDIGRRP
jgi:hypothetical protein